MDLSHQQIVFNVLKSAHSAGRPGMFRADIFAQPECETMETITQVSSA